MRPFHAVALVLFLPLVVSIVPSTAADPVFDCSDALAWSRNTIGVVPPASDVVYDVERYRDGDPLPTLPDLPSTGPPGLVPVTLVLFSFDADLYVLGPDCQTVTCASESHPLSDGPLDAALADSCTVGDANPFGFVVVRHHAPEGVPVPFTLHFCGAGDHVLPPIFVGFCPL